MFNTNEKYSPKAVVTSLILSHKIVVAWEDLSATSVEQK